MKPSNWSAELAPPPRSMLNIGSKSAVGRPQPFEFADEAEAAAAADEAEAAAGRQSLAGLVTAEDAAAADEPLPCSESASGWTGCSIGTPSAIDEWRDREEGEREAAAG